MDLEPVGAATLQGSFEVVGDDTYRVRAVDQTDYDQAVLGRYSGRLVLTSRSYALRLDDAVQRVALG